MINFIKWWDWPTEEFHSWRLSQTIEDLPVYYSTQRLPLPHHSETGMVRADVRQHENLAKKVELPWHKKLQKAIPTQPAKIRFSFKFFPRLLSKLTFKLFDGTLLINRHSFPGLFRRLEDIDEGLGRVPEKASFQVQWRLSSRQASTLALSTWWPSVTWLGRGAD